MKHIIRNLNQDEISLVSGGTFTTKKMSFAGKSICIIAAVTFIYITVLIRRGVITVRSHPTKLEDANAIRKKEIEKEKYIVQNKNYTLPT